MKKSIILIAIVLSLSSCATITPTKNWPEWARQDRDSNGAETTVQGRQGIGPGVASAVQGMFGDAVSRSNESRSL